MNIVREVSAELLGECAGRFGRVESRRLAGDALAGLQADLPRKNCWTIAKNAGHPDPWRLQHFFNDAVWDEDAVRETAAAAAWEQVASRPERVLVFAHPARMAAAGVPAEVGFATKLEQARQILARRMAAGQAPTAIAGDAVYGRSAPLRSDAERGGIAYVLAIPTRNWSDRSAGAGSRGQRVYAWAYLALSAAGAAGERGLLVRWNRRKDEYAYYLTYLPDGAIGGLARLIRIAGLRWPIETTFQDAKGCFGLDQHQMRKWASVRRWITLALLAACATALAYHRARAAGTRLTLTGLAHLYGEIIRAHHDQDFHYQWAEWICDRNDRARRSHYRRRGDFRPPALMTAAALGSMPCPPTNGSHRSSGPRAFPSTSLRRAPCSPTLPAVS